MKSSKNRRLLLLPALALAALSAESLLEGYTLNSHKWGTTTVSYYVNPQNKWVSQNAAVSAIQTAAAAWHDQSNANISLAYAGSTNGSSLQMNYKSEVFFRGGGGVAETYVWWDSSGRYVDGDIVLYEDAYQYFAFSGCTNGLYIENVAIHEFGHLLGLGHSSVAGATMQPAMPGYCDTSQLSLEADDIAGVRALYPQAGPAPNTAPSVAISAPGNNSTYVDASSITFAGSASDTQDGNLTSTLRWSSNLVGQIGTGSGFSRTLPAGTHLITAASSDSGGLSGTQLVTVIVNASASSPPAPKQSGVSLAARGYKVKGLQKADLSWSGLSASSVDVYRNGAFVRTAANSGAVTDAIDRKGNGAYTYRVCGSGTSTCSNDATVTF